MDIVASLVFTANVLFLIDFSHSKSHLGHEFKIVRGCFGSKIQVFLRIFELRPSVKYLFPFREVYGDQLLRHPMFVEQARRFIMIIASVVEAVDDLSSGRFGSPALTQLGRKHVKMEGFIGNYFHVFTQAVMSVWLQELGPSCTPVTADAWRTLFEYIIRQLEDGYNHEKESRGQSV